MTNTLRTTATPALFVMAERALTHRAWNAAVKVLCEIATRTDIGTEMLQPARNYGAPAEVARLVARVNGL